MAQTDTGQTTVVLIGEDIGAQNLARLRKTFPEVDFRFCLDDDSYFAAAEDAEIVFSKRFPAEAMRKATRLRWIQAGTAGVNHLLAMGFGGKDAGRGVLLTNASGAHGVPMSEVILSMMLAFATGLHTLIREQRQRADLQKQIIGTKFELEGQTLCVIGLGDIGGTLARKAKALGMRVLGVRRSNRPFEGIERLFPLAQLHAALAEADHVALCLPLTEETTALVGEAELRAMQPSAYIYNVGRGASIEPRALNRALAEGWIAGAGLDVTEPEPLPNDSPLWDAPNVILSQHSSGSSPYNADRITAIFEENLRRYLQGEPLLHQIDKVRGY